MKKTQDFESLINWYKINKPELIEKVYVRWNVGDIVQKTAAPEDYWIVYPSESYMIETGIYIPVRKVVNESNKITRIPGGKNGLQTFTCSEPIMISGKTDFFVFEWLSWEGEN